MHVQHSHYMMSSQLDAHYCMTPSRFLPAPSVFEIWEELWLKMVEVAVCYTTCFNTLCCACAMSSLGYQFLQDMYVAIHTASHLRPPVGTPPIEPASVDRLIGKADGLWCPCVVQMVATPCASNQAFVHPHSQ